MLNVRFFKGLFVGFLLTLLIPVSVGSESRQETVIHPLDAHLSQTYHDDLPGLLKRRYLRVLTTMNRTNFFLVGGKAYGFEYSLLKEYEKYLNRGRKKGEIHVVFEFVPVARDRLIPDLMEGYGAIAAAGLTVTDARKEKVDFTAPYLTGVDELPVVHKSVRVPETAEDLSGKRVFVRKSSSYFESLTELNRRLKKAGKKPVKILEADENLETEDILELVNTGAIERTVCDSHIARIWAGVFHDLRIADSAALRQGGAIAWMIRKNNPELKKSLNAFVRKHRKGTLLGNIFFSQYYEDNPWVKNPLSGDAGKSLAAYRALFQKYGGKYGFDWRLIAAMAFQESGLNPKKISPKGAVGIMQIRPETAADPNVGVGDVHRLENNVHAAVKYLAFLRDRYFSEEKIRESDRVRFSLAAYNAGPAKIREARALARKMKLDADRWFRNAELAALRMLGQETVRYVSNINKYYVIYTTAFERQETREKAKENLR